MEDHVLMARLDALRNGLSMLAAKLDSNAWQREGNQPNARAELLGESLWTGLQTLITEINRRIAVLKQIDEDLRLPAPDEQAALSAVWVRYGKCLRDSEDLLRECLEIIGSLAIRNQDLDDQLLYVGDELIRDCMTVSISEALRPLCDRHIDASIEPSRSTGCNRAILAGWRAGFRPSLQFSPPCATPGPKASASGSR